MKTTSKIFLFLLFVHTSLPAQTCPQSFILRQESCPVGGTSSCTAKGSSLTWSELDKDILNSVGLCNTVGRFTWPVPAVGILRSDSGGIITLISDDDTPDNDGEVPDAITISGGTLSGTNTQSGTLTVTGTMNLDSSPEGILRLPVSTTLPATCTLGDTYYDSDADTDGSFYVCRATNTWKEMDDDGTGSSLTSVESGSTQRIFTSPLGQANAGFLLTSGTAYFVYVGKTTATITPQFVEWYMSTGGTGAQTAEVGLFSTPLAPNKTAQTFTKIVATGTVSELVTTTTTKRNTSAFATSVPLGTHLWAGIRTAMATTQPTLWGLSMDMGEGFCQTTAASGVLTGTGPFSGALVSASTTSAICPILRVTMD